MVVHELVAQVEGASLGVGSGEGGDLYTVARDGLHTVVELHMQADHLVDRHIAADGHAAALGLGQEREERQERHEDKPFGDGFFDGSCLVRFCH